MPRSWATVRELGAVALAAAAAIAAALAVDGVADPATRWVVAVGLGAGLAAVQLALFLNQEADGSGQPPSRTQSSGQLDRQISTVFRLLDRPAAIERALAEVLADAGLTEVFLYEASQDGRELVATAADGTTHSLPLDERASAWLVANPGPIHSRQLGELPLGGLRRPVEEFVHSLGGNVLLPLVYRDELVGVATARGNGRRVLRGRHADTVHAAQAAASSAVTELRLRAAEASRSAVEREVQRAAQIQVDATAGSLVETLAGWLVVRQLVPARQFSGAWWTAAALPGSRLLVALGEVTGRGVPAALLSASAAGVCQAAARTLGSALEPQQVLELVHRSLRQAGGGAYSMSCFVAVLDAGARLVSFAGAGHPFPYLLRADGRGLGALVSRGNLLGGHDEPVISASRMPIAPGDAVLFYSASATDARSPSGEAFGERRLRRLVGWLGTYAASNGAVPAGGLAEQIATHVQAHVGDGALEDDLLVATVAMRLHR